MALMKTVYLVRHGESEANLRNYAHGDENSPLTALGRDQAKRIAERCAKLPIELILSSNMLRAKETAVAISRMHSVPTETHDIFRERTMPSALEAAGNQRYEGDFLKMRDAWLQSFYVDDEQVLDGENFRLIKERAAKALSFLEQRPESNILLVAHGFILRTMLACIIFSDAFTAEELKNLMQRMLVDNTGISVFHYDPEGTERSDNMPRVGWFVQIWNDHAHLG